MNKRITKMTLQEELIAILGKDNLICNENLSRHTTLRIGGPARFWAVVNTEEILKNLLLYLEEKQIRFYLLGNGSNVLAEDDGFDGVIIKLAGEFNKCSINNNDNAILAGAAVSLAELSRAALNNEFTGLEFASGIPGTVGGALVMNAGAYGGEMKQVVQTVKLLEKENAGFVVKTYTNEEMNFSYRHSIAKEKEVIFLEASFELAKGNAAYIKASMDEMNKSRREKQPLEYPSAGSTFKRPEGYFAGKLISDAGLKGYAVGDARVSEKHAGFCINTGNATAADFKKLMEDVSEKVYELYQVKLEPEVIILK